MDISEYLSAGEAAAELGYTRDAVGLLCRTGKLPGAVKKGAIWWIPRSSVASYIPGPQGFAAHPDRNPRKRRD